MSDHDEDLELQALQRRLDDAFETTRPRRGFEDELWLRMQERRPLGDRVRDAVSGLIAGFRQAPAVPAAAVALLLIVAVGVAVLGSNLGRFGSHESATAGSGGTALSAAPGDQNALPGGRLPSPALHPGLVDQSNSGYAPLAPSSMEMPPNLYFGPANLTWTGTFPTSAGAAPVLVYAEPSPQQVKASGTFSSGHDVTVTTRASIAQLPLEPTFLIREVNPGVAAGADPIAAAGSFLAAHNVLPPWPYNVVVQRSGGVTRVVYQRGFTAADGTSTYFVNWYGERYGTEVDIVDGRRTAVGPLPLGLAVHPYPLISDAQAAQTAVSAAPAASESIHPTPTVSLDRVELVYALAIAGGSGFYEPAYLFSGTFSYNGQTYTKRVLVPLVDPSLRS